MCIRDRLLAVLWCDVEFVLVQDHRDPARDGGDHVGQIAELCLLYTSDAAAERSSVDLGGRRIIKKKHNTESQDNRKLCRTQKQNITK